MFIDGHEHEDVVKDRTKFLNEVHKLQGEASLAPCAVMNQHMNLPHQYHLIAMIKRWL